MPRNTRKRRLNNPHKTQLTFVETPINGDIHCYGPQPRSAINPRSLISEERRPTGITWVSPQFDQTRLPDVPKRVRRCHSQSVSSTRHNSTCSNIKKTAACKYPSLSFETSAAERLHCKNKHLIRGAKLDPMPESNQSFGGPGPSNTLAKVDLVTPQRTCSLRRRNVESTLSSNKTHEGSESRKASSSPVPHMCTRMKNFTVPSETLSSAEFSSPHVENDFMPPDIDTPEMPHKVTSSSKCTFLDLLLPTTPPHSYNLDVLVEDTPERDYGLKVTWRKRKNFMKLLMKRGQLTTQQAEVVA
ncbi:hypothetical protein ACEWY4_001840 [Coilia grayii]|uniref:RAD9, HUS1, RAD1-interacting nuclear orphan protein 1 n=1 Tax=Coilia grayii TaxID=363190 RepID=A0ABD1KU48_9TELE